MDSASVRELRSNAYETARTDVAAHVPTHARNILELGCSTGTLGSYLKQRQPARIVGVEIDPSYAAEAGHRLDRVVVGSAEAFVTADRPPEAPFDCLIAADVLEHLVDPWTVLRQALGMLAPSATVVISVPNVLYFNELWRVLRTGRWPREDVGIFDRTHLRWFGLEDAKELATSAGLEVVRVEPQFWARGWRLQRRRLLYRTRLGRFMAAQYIVVAVKPVPDEQ